MVVENRGPQLAAVCGTFVATAFVATALRCYARVRLVKAFGWDDWCMAFAALTHIMFATCAIAGVHYGTGRHFKDLTPENIMMAMRYWWLCYVAYCLTMIAAKISIGLLLLRLTINRIHIWIIWIVMLLTVITGVVFFFVTLFQCSPVSYFWDQAIGAPGSCIDIEIIIGLTYLYSAINAVCDFTFGLLPIFLVWNLQMDLKSKILLVPILSMACIASSAVLVRMAYVKDFKSDDFLWATVDIAIWSDTEQGLAITAGSLATLRPLFRSISSKLGFSATSGSGPLQDPSSKRPSYVRGPSRKSRSPFSLITMTNLESTDDYHRMGDLKAAESGTVTGQPDKSGSTWNERERDNSTDDGLNNRRRIDIETGFKNGIDSKW